ncbi:MAG: hypothetical protein WCO26_25360 [Deltaproteobacteria bacterium]
MEELRICFIGHSSQTFTRMDAETLSRYFPTEIIEPSRRAIGWPAKIVEITKGVTKCDVAFCWFAEWYSAVAAFFLSLFGKRTNTVVGGYDVATIFEIEDRAFNAFKE